MNLGHRVKEIFRDDDTLVIEETATMGAVAIFLSMAAVFLIFASRFPAISLICALGWILAAFFASIKSTFTIKRPTGEIIVARHFHFGTTERIYPRSEVVRIFEKRTFRNGSGIAMKLRSRKEKNMTMSLGFQTDLREIAQTMNEFRFR